jgi:hypothetical protein
LRMMGHVNDFPVRRVLAGKIHVAHGVGPDHFVVTTPVTPPRGPTHREIGDQGVVRDRAPGVAHSPTVPSSDPPELVPVRDLPAPAWSASRL